MYWKFELNLNTANQNSVTKQLSLVTSNNNVCASRWRNNIEDGLGCDDYDEGKEEDCDSIVKQKIITLARELKLKTHNRI